MHDRSRVANVPRPPLNMPSTILWHTPKVQFKCTNTESIGALTIAAYVDVILVTRSKPRVGTITTLIGTGKRESLSIPFVFAVLLRINID